MNDQNAATFFLMHEKEIRDGQRYLSLHKRSLRLRLAASLSSAPRRYSNGVFEAQNKIDIKHQNTIAEIAEVKPRRNYVPV